MKTTTTLAILAIAAAVSTRSAIFEFDLGGPAGNQMLSGNVVPNPGDPQPTTDAFGTEHSIGDNGGIFYDTDHGLEFHVDVFNFVGTAQSAQLRGPASTTENSSTVVGDIPFVNNVGDGRVFLDLYTYFLTEDQLADLQNGLYYVQLNSAAYPESANGELRAQLLTAVPEPESYALAAGLGLLGFALVRRAKNSFRTCIVKAE